MTINLPVVLLGGGLPSRLEELLESDESESLELEPELPEDDLEDLCLAFTRARASATANLLLVLPNWSTFDGAGGFWAPALIIP